MQPVERPKAHRVTASMARSWQTFTGLESSMMGVTNVSYRALWMLAAALTMIVIALSGHSAITVTQ